MPYVLFNSTQEIIGIFENPQPEQPEVVWIEESDSRWIQKIVADRKQEILRSINTHAEGLFAQLTAPYPPSESLTWPYKLKEAEAFLSTGNDLLADNLRIEASQRQIPLQSLAQIIATKSQQYRARCAQISGARGRHADAIALLQTREELEAYDWRSGWD